MAKTFWRPSAGTITQNFAQHLANGSAGGIDIACPIGTPVYACADGVVEISRYSPVTHNNPRAYGNFIQIRHATDQRSLVAHLSVRYAGEGQVVKKGDLIGLSGNTGYAFGPHVHWQCEHLEPFGWKRYNQEPDTDWTATIPTTPSQPVPLPEPIEKETEMLRIKAKYWYIIGVNSVIRIEDYDLALAYNAGDGGKKFVKVTSAQARLLIDSANKAERQGYETLAEVLGIEGIREKLADLDATVRAWIAEEDQDGTDDGTTMESTVQVTS